MAILNFLTKIKSFWKLYADYGYDGETVEFIIDTYEKLLCERTETMSKPTYYIKDILSEIDRWYEEHRDIKVSVAYNSKLRRIDFLVDFRNIDSKEQLAERIIKELGKKTREGFCNEQIRIA